MSTIQGARPDPDPKRKHLDEVQALLYDLGLPVHLMSRAGITVDNAPSEGDSVSSRTYLVTWKQFRVDADGKRKVGYLDKSVPGREILRYMSDPAQAKITVELL